MIFDHIGIVTGDLDTGAAQLAAMHPIEAWTRRFDDAGLGVSVRFGRDRSGLVYELIAPFGENSPVAGTLARRANILNQVAYRVEDLAAAATALRAAKAVPTSRPAPALAFGGAQVSRTYL